MVGLSSNDSDFNYLSINYALFHERSAINNLYVYENGSRAQSRENAGILGSSTANSVFKIKFNYGGKIEYYCDEKLIYVSYITSPANNPLPTQLVVDFSMYDIGSQIIDLQIFKCCPDADSDGVCDIDDRCPNQAGTLASNGCPSCGQDIISIGDNETKKYTIDVGTATGTVRLDYIGFENPDKFEMSWNGATKGSTAYNSSGYVGKEDYFHNGSTINAHQTLLNLGIPEAEIKLSTQKTPTYFGQGYMSIYKESSYPSTVDVYVKPGLGLSQGDFTLNCPYKSEYNCNNQVVSNGVTGSFTYKVDVGTATGTIQLNYNAFNLPDKFEMSWNGALDGSPSYNSSGYRGLFTNQSQQQLINLGIPLSDIHLENPSIGSGTIFINKTAANPTTVEVTVTAPISETGWNFSVVCPSLPSAAGKPNRNSMITSSVSPEKTKCYTVHFPLPKKINENDSLTTAIIINEIPLNAEGKNYDLTSTTTNGSSYSLTDFISHLTQTFGTTVSIIDNEVTLTALNVYMGFETITLQSTNRETKTYSYTELDCNNANRKTIISETLKNTITNAKSTLKNLIKNEELTKKAEELIDKSTTASNLSTAPLSQSQELKKSNKLANTATPSGSTYKTFFSQIREQVMSQYTFSFAGATSDPDAGSGCGSKLNLDFLIQGDIPSFDSAASSLGSSKTESKSTGFYLGLGIGKKWYTKMTTFGVQFNWGNDRSEGMTALIDINGDGLDDIVTKENDELNYKKHVVTLTYNDKGEPVRTHSFESKRPISGINNFYRAYGRSNSKNFQVNFGTRRVKGFVGWDKSSSKSETDIYFTDGNGDGLMDIVRDGVVYFNRLDPNGNPNYIADSEGTENLVITAAARTVEVPDDYNEETNTTPALDVVKVWEAPADGEIQIDNTITLTDSTKEAVATIEMKNSVAPVTKCYEVSFPVPSMSMPFYQYEIGSGITQGNNFTNPLSNQVIGTCFSRSWRIKQVVLNNVPYLPNNPNLLFYINGNSISGKLNQCPNYLPPIFPLNTGLDPTNDIYFDISIRSQNSEAIIQNWYASILNSENISYFSLNYNNYAATYLSPETVRPEFQYLYLNRSDAFLQFKSTLDNITGSIIEEYSDDDNIWHDNTVYNIYPGVDLSALWKKPIGNLNFAIPTTISVNSSSLQGNPYSLYDNFGQFKVAFEAQYPDSMVTSSNDIVTIKINNTTETFSNITLTPTNGSPANPYTYTFTEVSCTNVNRLSAGKANKKTSQQDDWKSYKPSKEEIELAIKKWEADGKELNEPIADNFPLNYVIDATKNTINKNVSGTYLYMKDNTKTSWKNAKGVTVKDKKTIIILNQLLPADMEKVYANLKEKNKQQTIERRKKSQIEAQAWLDDYHKKQEEKNNKNTANRMANPTNTALTYSPTTCTSTPGDLGLLFGTTLNSATPNATVTNSLTQNTAGQNLYVKKGDRIYFRVHSIANGNPPVNWDPKVSYTNPDVLATTDANGATPFSSSYSDSFVMSSSTPIQFPGNSGKATIKWTPITVNNLTDKVTFEIIKRKVISSAEESDEAPDTVTEDLIFSQECLPNLVTQPSVSTPSNLGIEIVIPDDASQPQIQFYFKVTSASNVDWKNIQWRPTIECEVQNEVKNEGGTSEGTITTKQKLYPVPEYSLYRLYSCGPVYNKLNVASLNLGQGSYIKPNLAGIFNSSDKGTINFVVKSGTKFLGSRSLTILNNAIAGDTSIPLNINDISSSELEISYTIDDSQNENESSLLSKIALSTTTLATIYNGSTSTIVSKNNINLYQRPIQNFGSFYKQWGQFFYNPAAVTGAASSGIPNINLIKEQALVIDEDTLNDLNTAGNYLDSLNDMTDTDLTAFQNQNEHLINSNATYPASPNREFDVSTGTFIDRWKGMHTENYSSEFAFRAATMEQATSSMESFEPNTEQAVLKTGAIAISKYSKGSANNFSAGLNFSVAGGNASLTNNGLNNSLTDYVDYNGDRYPDIVTTKNIQYTNKTGGLFPPPQITSTRIVSQSKSTTVNLSASGSFSNGGKEAASTNGTGSSYKRFINFLSNSGLGISPPSFSEGNSNTKKTWLDINGDGLTDLVENDNDKATVSLNIGQSVLAPYNTINLQPFDSNSYGISSGSGISRWNGSFQADISVTASMNSTKNMLVDINGDGLMDVISSNGTLLSLEPYINVQLNLGNTFQNYGTWNTNYNLNKESQTTSASLSAGITFSLILRFWGIPFKIPAMSFSGSPYGTSTNRTKKSISDFDGDGYPDLIEEVSKSKVKVYSSKIRRTDMLKSVTNPLGGSFVIDYKVQPVSYGNPHAKWAMSSIQVNDGYNKSNDGQDTYRKEFVYEDGKYDRREREFYGYKKVKVVDYLYDTDGKPTKPYRTSVSVYHNDSYFLNGLLKESYVMKGSDESKLFSKTINTYEIKQLSPDNQTIQMPQVTLPNTFDVGGSEGRRSAVVLLTNTVNELYEGNSSPKLTSEVNMMYDARGRVSIYNNRGNTAITTDDYTSGIAYHDNNTALNAKNIISVPRRIKVFSGIITDEQTINNSTASLRERTTTTDDNGNITSIAAKISGTTTPVNAVTTMTYDSYGNLKSIVYPPNDATPTTPKKYTYEYDPIYNKYVISITDGLGYSSIAIYDSRFDKVTKTTDLSGNIMTYTYDSFGRLNTIQAPKEIGVNDFTLKFHYFTKLGDLPNEYGITAANFAPVALTQHFDPTNPANPIETYTFIDGLARPIQVKKDITINTGSPTAPNYKEALSVSGKASYDRYGRAESQYFPTFEIKPENGSIAKNFVLNETEPPIKSSTITLYDELDRPIQVQDPDGNNTTTDYSIEGVGNTVGATFIKTKSTAKQNGTNNVVTETYKDVFGRVAYTNNLTSTTEGLLTQFTYNAIGELLSYTDAQGISTTYTYDNLGRKLSVTHPDNGLTSFQYDRASNLTRMQTANLRANTNPAFQPNTFISYTYDSNNRLTKIVFPVATGAPSPNLSDVTYTYGLPADLPNKRGKLIKQTDATGEQTFDYGNMGEMVYNERKIVATNTPTRTFKTYFDYDSWNRLKTMTYPDAEVINYTYDFGGNLTKMTGTLNGAPYNYVAQIDYDYFEQKTYMKYGNGSETTYSYSPNLRQLNNLKVVSNTQSLFDNTYSYDQVGNVTGIANTAGITTNNMGGIYNHAYTYDKLNRLSTATGNFTGSPTQTANNNDSQSNYTLEMGYNNTHGIASKKQLHFKNGVSTPFEENSYENVYNYVANTHRLLTVVNPNNTDTYTYDRNGNLLTRSNQIGVLNSNYYWDESNRLKFTQRGNNMQQYTYDASGERVIKRNVNFTATTVNGAPVINILSVETPTTYPSAFMVVDPLGNCSNHYYIGSQRIVSRLSDKPASDYVTGSVLRQSPSKKDGNRSDKDVQLLQKNDFQALVEKNNLGKVTYAEYKPYTYEEIEKALKEEEESDDEPNTARMANTSTPPPAAVPIYFYHPDHLGTSTFLTDANGNAYQFFLNLPFGETMAEQLPSSSYTSPYKFNGKELDAETGLYYYGARYYDPKGSIWLSTDPLAEKFPAWSPYAYAFNNPIVLTDPDGREPIPFSLRSWINGIKPSQWYTHGYGLYDSKTFNSAASYNTQHLNANSYQNVYQRNSYYGWVQSQADAKGYNSKWFGAAQLVTKWNAVGGTAISDGDLFTSAATDKFLQGGNKFLFSHNMKNAKDLLADGKLSGGFTDANGSKQSFEGLTGMALDFKMVEFEQSKVQEYINSYKGNDLNSIISNINELMTNPVGPSEINSVMDKSFNGGKSFNFKNYADRVKLGQELIKKAHDE